MIDLGHPTQARQQRRWRFDVAGYVRLHEAGLIPDDVRTELMEGEIRIMAPIGPDHGSTVNALHRLFVEQLGRRAFVSAQSSFRLGARTLLQPDIAVLRPEPADYFHRFPEAADVLLIVEVAKSSLRYDRARKVPLYARHGVPEVWLVDVGAAAAEIFREPSDGLYGSVTRLTVPAAMTPLAWPEVTIELGHIVRSGRKGD